MGWVGLEPTTGGLGELRPGAPDAPTARIPLRRATDAPHCTVCTDGSVHEPVQDHHSERLTSTTERDDTPREIRRYGRQPWSPGAYPDVAPNRVICKLLRTQLAQADARICRLARAMAQLHG